MKKLKGLRLAAFIVSAASALCALLYVCTAGWSGLFYLVGFLIMYILVYGSLVWISYDLEKVSKVTTCVPLVLLLVSFGFAALLRFLQSIPSLFDIIKILGEGSSFLDPSDLFEEFVPQNPFSYVGNVLSIVLVSLFTAAYILGVADTFKNPTASFILVIASMAAMLIWRLVSFFTGHAYVTASAIFALLRNVLFCAAMLMIGFMEVYPAFRQAQDQKKVVAGMGAAPGQPYQGQPYQGQPYQGQPYQGQPYQGQPYQGQPSQGQPSQAPSEAPGQSPVQSPVQASEQSPVQSPEQASEQTPEQSLEQASDSQNKA